MNREETSGPHEQIVESEFESSFPLGTWRGRKRVDAQYQFLGLVGLIVAP
jgi:hypothetical protein